MTRLSLAALVLFACVLATLPAAADDLAYSDIDRATVRVLALGTVDIEEVEHKQVKYPVAIPLAGHGSGVLVGADGLILTAEHVVADSRAIAVMIPGYPKALPAVVVYENEDHDVALVRVLGTYTQVAKLADPSDVLAVRQTVFAIGYPLDAKRTDPQSTQGIVSGKLPDGALQLGMTVNPGNSGGPVVDEQGLVRGIVIARSRLDQGAVGLAYAVPLGNIVGPVSQQENTPLSTEKDTYLRTDAAQLSAELTTAMSQYGLEVLEASLSGGSLDLDPKLRKTLNEASYGEHASIDGRLMSAAMYWNQSLVQQARGKSVWRKSRQYAVKLAKEAVKLEPKLKKESKFISVVLAGDPGDGTFHPFANTTPVPSSGGNMDTLSRFDSGPTTFPDDEPKDKKPSKTKGGYFDFEVGYANTKRSDNAKGASDYFGGGFGYWTGDKARFKVGGVLRRHSGTTYTQCQTVTTGYGFSGDRCESGSLATTLVGATVGLGIERYFAVGLGLDYISVTDSGVAEDESGVAFELDAGLRIPIKTVDLQLNTLLLTGAVTIAGVSAGVGVFF
ncbi:MAG: trypsin-like peptidase domain-containing protein [Polyangiaceae bacterium]|nr:trypsin-like peptidase domain-containing protein [Polyangiaceae bacterium]MCB9609992.1 trypsin-like peptidase domain-containing protein [Polyangiaceae bacterium]